MNNNNQRQTRLTTRHQQQHDENAAIGARMTRSKAAANGIKPSIALDGSKPNNASRKRAALGDLSNNPNKDTGAKGAKSNLVSLKPTASSQAKAVAKKATKQPTLAPSAKISASSHLKNARNQVPATRQPSQIEDSRVLKQQKQTSALPIPVYTQQQQSKTNIKNSHKLDHDDVLEEPPAKKAKTTTKQQQQQEWDDLDEEDMDDPLMVSEYAPEIFDFLYNLQKQYMPNPDYMDDQKSLEWEYRSILVDWLVEVHTKFRLLPETLFLAVNIVDRFLSCRVISLQKVQLVGIASLFVAAKYEEVYTPAVRNYSYVSDGGYDVEEILSAERYLLQVLNFQISYPNPMNFLRRISKADNYDLETRTIGKYLLEISLFDHRMLKFYPSDVAAAAMYLSKKILQKEGGWDANLVHYSGDCDEQMLEPIVALMVDYLHSPVKHEAFFKKYASKRFMKASIIARAWAKEHANEYPVVPSSDR